MTAPRTVLEAVLGCRSNSSHAPNISDKSSDQSVAISIRLLDLLDLLHDPQGPDGFRIAAAEGQGAGTELERIVRADLELELATLAPNRGWQVRQPGRPVKEFAQYSHLGELDRAIDADITRVLATTIGRDYQVEPDITIGEELHFEPLPMLHASVSCKLTLRSDRAQNIRLEAATLIRYRRGRLPHIVAVTAEPLPTRLASIAAGTGEIDAVFHIALPELMQSVEEVGNVVQTNALEELISQRRLRPYSELARQLVSS